MRTQLDTVQTAKLFNVVQIARAFDDGTLSLQQACQELDILGYTPQERRRVIRGVGRAREIRNGVPKTTRGMRKNHAQINR